MTADEEEDGEEEDSAVFDKGDMAAEDGNDLYDKAAKPFCATRVLDLLHPAPPRHRPQPRRFALAERMEKEGSRRAGQPCGQARSSMGVAKGIEVSRYGVQHRMTGSEPGALIASLRPHSPRWGEETRGCALTYCHSLAGWTSTSKVE